MKKSMLAMSVAAAIGGLGFAGSALAIVNLGGQGATAGATMVRSAGSGVGHQLLFPYFSTQGDNATLLSIVNTDTVGKVVKVRFRGAGNSDDLLDFQVLMSPGDVWTAAVSQDATTGVSKLTTQDNTCTVGLVTGLASTLRVDPEKDGANETREGYVEVINMADIVTGSDLYNTIKHDANGVAECDAEVIDDLLGTDVADEAEALTRGMTNPTSGLFGDWILLNQANTAAWSGAATALVAVDANNLLAAGNVVFWPQKFGPVSNVEDYSADPLFAGSSPIVEAQQYDLPDLSTPYVASVTTPAEQADLASSTMAVRTLANQFVTNESIAAVTDWVFSQPTRRYSVAVDYDGTGSAIYRDDGTTLGSIYFNTANTSYIASERQVCLDTTSAPSIGTQFDREERTPVTAPTDFVQSPNVPGEVETVLLCGETSVYSINAESRTEASALNASVARGNYIMDYTDGWAAWGMGNDSTGVPVLGSAFIRAANGTVNYGFAYPHRSVGGFQAITRAVAPLPN